MNPEFDDEMVLSSQYYQPAVIYSQFIAQQGPMLSEAKSKPRRRRKKNKADENGGEGATMRKRKLSEEQANMLERSFGDEHKLESERKDKLASELGLDPRQVAVWFQNRRARWKSKKLEEEYQRLKSEHETTVVEKCRLESEILKLREQLKEADREIQRLSSDGFSSNNSPCSSFSMEAAAIEPHFLGIDGLSNVFYNVQENNYAHGLEWDNLYYV